MMVTAFNGHSGEITLLDPVNPLQPVHAQVYKLNLMSDHWSIRINNANYNLPYYYINDVLEIRSLL
jgi:hypothetical protein